MSAIRTLLAVAVFTGVSSANAQLKDMSDMDDARYYLVGSVGYADSNYNQSDISDFDGLSPDSSDVKVRGGLGIKVDTELSEVFEFSVVTQFDTGPAYKPIGRIGFFSFDGDKTDGDELLIGVGDQRANLRFEVQRYDFDIAPINTVSFTYMYPFSN